MGTPTRFPSFTATIWRAAQACFGKQVFGLWPQIIFEAEDTVWHCWNQKYGPLNAAQIEYASSLVCGALLYAQGFPEGERMRRYIGALRWRRNHEETDKTMKCLADDGPEYTQDILGELGA